MSWWWALVFLSVGMALGAVLADIIRERELAKLERDDHWQ
jgi:hypothetical protein